MFPLIEAHYKKNINQTIKNLSYRAGTEWAAQDVAHEAYYRAMRYFDSYNPDEEFGKWFSMILNNCLREYKNDEKGHSQKDYEEVEAFPIHNDQIMRDVNKIISTKSPVQQEVLNYYFKQDYSPTDISRITEYSYANCHKIIQRFREEFKELYRE